MSSRNEFRNCIICNELFKIKRTSNTKCCSHKCSLKYFDKYSKSVHKAWSDSKRGKAIIKAWSESPSGITSRAKGRAKLKKNKEDKIKRIN